MATSLKHVQSAMQGDTLTQELPIDFEPTTINPEPTTVGQQQYVVFKLVKKGQRRLHIDGVGQALNEKKVLERIWLIRGAPSIWSTQLVEFLKDKEYVNRNRISLDFYDGICRVPVMDALMLEYARVNIHNVKKNRHGSGKYDYYEYDAAEEQKMRYDKQLSRINTIQLISNMEEQKMIKLALFLGVKPYDEETSLPKTPDGFRTELLIKADTQSEVVNRYVNSQEVEVSYLVRKAIGDAKIDLGGQTANVSWASGGGFICKIPSGSKPVAYLTELAMTNSSEGKKFKEQLETIVT